MNYGNFTLVARLAGTAARAGAAVMAMLFLCRSAQCVPAPALTVSVMPSHSQNPNQGNAAINEAIQVWGRVYGGSGTYATYTLDFGDGSAVATGEIDNAHFLPQTVAQDGSLAIPAYIGAGHAYSTAGSKTVRLTVKDSLGATASQTSTVRVLVAPTHEERVSIAIENGLRYLYLGQTPDGPSKCYWTDKSNQYGWASAGLSLMALEENGHLAGNDRALDVYAETVQKGINGLVSAGVSQAITVQHGKVTDTNRNGRGIYVGSGVVYDDCLVALAIIGAYQSKAAAQAARIPYASIEVPSSRFPGVVSFYDFAVDMIDTLLWSQSDTGIGGWHYSVNIADNGGADGSTHQWPNMVFVAAKDRWGLLPPAWAVTNSLDAYVALQDHTGDPSSNFGYGGCGYGSYNSWRNNGKTGGMLVAYILGGKLVGTDLDATIGYDFIGRTWIAPPSDGTGVDINSGWPGNWYYMYGIKKGLQLQKVATVSVQYDDRNSGPRDWYQDLSAWLLGNAALLDAPLPNNPNKVKISSDLRTTASLFGQFPDGHWEGHAWPSNNSYPVIQTAGAILTLTKSITVAVPVAVIAPVPDQSPRKPAAFQLDGSASYDLDPSRSIVEWLWKFDAGAHPDWSHPDATGQRPIVNPGWNTVSAHTVTLRVKDNQTPAQYGTTTAKVNVTINDHPPVAVPLPPLQVPQVYAGKIGATIQLDGTASHDVDGDPIISYAWDLNGDGIYGDATDQALDTSGSRAHGPKASIVFGAPHSGVVGLQVGSQALGSPPLFSANQAAVDIYASASDLSVQSLSVTNVHSGSSADAHAVLKNDSVSGSGFSGVLVRLYTGDPYGAGVQIGGNHLVNLPIGSTAKLDVHLPLIAGQKFIYVKVDANNVIPEWNEQNNVAAISLVASGNHPPVARAENAVVIAGTNRTANASIDDGSYDPDAGDRIVIRQIPDGPYPIGVTNVTLLVTDSYGASSQARATVTVLDQTPPALSLPANIVVNTDPGQSTAIVTYSVSAKDGLSTSRVSIDIPSGTAFPVGTSVVTATATDASGNAVSGTFTVTVKDAEPPVVAEYADLAVEATSDAGAIVNYGAATAIDNVGVVSLTYSVASGTRFALGVTPVTITVKDAAGNVGTETFSVRVLMKSEPRAVQPTVPSVVHLTQARAQTAITNAKLYVGAITTAASTTVPAGNIISQAPVAGKSVPPNSIVSLVVSLGAPISVPNVVGLSVPRARAALAAAHLRAGRVTKVNSTTVPIGSIVSQTPAAGASALAGSGINLTESFGPAPAGVPRVVGLTQAQAETAITEAGLIVGSVATITSATVPPGIVINQTPVGGSTAAVDSAVQITVSLGMAVTVPNVVGLTQAQAQTALSGRNLTVGDVSQAYSSAVATGHVVSQAPGAGSILPQASPIDLVVSLGPPSVRVPNVVGLAESRARADLLDAKLAVGTEISANSSTVPAGNVISQSPVAGATVPYGSAVTLTISLGPTLSAVPSVVGLTQARAQAALAAAKLTLGTITTANSTAVAAGNVISQSPVAGTITTKGAAVALTISLGPPPVTVPNVVGQTQAQAQTALTAAKLTFGTITTAISSTVAVGHVMSQTPAAGATAPQGSAVDLTVSLGPPITVPSVVGLPQSQAATTIISARLAVGSADKATSATVPAGNVISQTPVAGAMVAQNSAINLIISLGPPPATVPNVVGFTQARAQAALVTTRLSMGPLISVTNARVPAGNVISQSPAAGTTVSEGSPVNLTVSLGPPVRVPDVVGLVQAQAQTNIATANLAVGIVATAHSTTVAAGKVISQTPSAGATAAKGSAVDLIVSSGATIATVPNVVGLTQANAGSAIVASGLTVGTATTGINATIPAGQVFGQSPAPGAVVAAPSPVNITVSAGPGNTVVPNLAGLTQLQASAALFPAQLLIGTVTLNPSTTVPAGKISAQSPSAGATATQGTSVNVTISTGPLVNDGANPVVTIQGPADNSTVSFLTDVVATVSDAHLALYQVHVARADKVDLTNLAADSPDYTLIGQGTSSVAHAKVATFDPTILANDTYVIRVRAIDQGGRSSAAATIINASANAKLGRFALDFTDLSVPLVGIPIQIVRHYDTFNAGTSGDFGYGWSLGIRDAQIRALLKPGFAGPSLAPNSRLYLTTPDGRRVGFTANFQVLSQFIGTIVQVNFTPDPGVYEKVEILDGNQCYLIGGVFGSGLLGIEVYVPQKYRLTLKDGTQYDYDTTAGLEKITDLNGNTVTFTANGITHSSGQVIPIVRDAQNRITKISDPAGKSVTYAYTAQGDLISFTDRTGAQTRFTYRAVPKHFLDTVIDPLGRLAVRVTYDVNGRVVAITDALGHPIRQQLGDGLLSGTFTDANGDVTALQYDTLGNLITVTDPEGNLTRMSYGDPKNPTRPVTVIYPSGETAKFQYDDRGEIVQIADPAGNKTNVERDARSQILSITDPMLRKWSFSYDQKGNLTSETNPKGGVVRYAYNDMGRPVGRTDTFQNKTTMEYNPSGFLTKTTSPSGSISTFAYDPTGNMTSASRNYTDSGGAQRTAVQKWNRNAEGLVTAYTDPTGNTTRIEYDGSGKAIRRTNALNLSRNHLRDANGRIIQTAFEDGTVEKLQYDSVGQLIQEVDRYGQTSKFTYDKRGHRTKEKAADGAEIVQHYNADGLPDQILENGARYGLAYDSSWLFRKDAIVANQPLNFKTVSKITEPGGVSRQFSKDGDGNPKTISDGTNVIASIDTDPFGFPSTVTSPGKSPVGVNSDNAGRLSSGIGRAVGRVSYQYDADGRVNKVTDALGNTTIYAYNELGHRIKLTDGNGAVVKWDYDALGRTVVKHLPSGRSQRFAYSGADHISSRTDPDGRVVTFQYDTGGRVTTTSVNGHPSTKNIYDTVGRRVSASNRSGEFHYEYDNQGRMSKVTFPNGAVVKYSFDQYGRISTINTQNYSTKYLYDISGRLKSVAGNDGASVNIAADSATSSMTITCGNRVSYTKKYGASNELSEISLIGPTGQPLASRKFEHDQSGALVHINDASTGQVSFGYDGAARLKAETYPALGIQKSYSLDSVGNRSQMTNGSVTANLRYDANNALLNDGTWSYQYDLRGNRKSRKSGPNTWSYQFDDEDRLQRVTSPSGSIVEYGYDPDGNLYSRAAAGVTEYFLCDVTSENGRIIENLDSAGSRKMSWAWSEGGVLWSSNASGSYYTHPNDGQSVWAVTDSHGLLVSKLDYDAFGNVIKQSGPYLNRLAFVSHFWDAEVGLSWSAARFYDPTIGRFISSDPLEGNDLDPVTWNPYLYAHANPIVYRDPSGKQDLIEESFLQKNAFRLVGGLIDVISATFVSTRFRATYAEALANVAEAVSLGKPSGLFASAGFSAGGENSFGSLTAGVSYDVIDTAQYTEGYISGRLNFSIGYFPNHLTDPLAVAPSKSVTVTGGFAFNAGDPTTYTGPGYGAETQIGSRIQGVGISSFTGPAVTTVYVGRTSSSAYALTYYWGAAARIGPFVPKPKYPYSFPPQL